MRRQSRQIGKTLRCACAGLAILGFSACSGSNKPTPTPGRGEVPELVGPIVKVVEGGANGVPLDSRTFPFPLTPSGDALTYVSSKVGFQVTVPGYLPSGYLLTEIDIPPRPPAAIDSSGLPLHVFLKISNGSAGFQIQEANVRYTVDENPSHLIASPSADTHVYKDAGNLTTNYTLAAPTRVIELTTGAPDQLRDDEVVRILTSVP